MAADSVTFQNISPRTGTGELGQTVAISGTYTSPTIDGGDPGRYEELRLLINGQQAGTYFIDQSQDGVTWQQTATGATVAATPLKVTENVFARYLRVRWTNASGAATSTLVLLAALPTIGA